jgi:hypothetical protein
VRGFIGVLHLTEGLGSTSIKQKALLFNRIAVLNFRSVVPRLREQVQPRKDDFFDTLEWLFEEGIIFEPEEIIPDEKILAMPEYQRFSDLTNEYANKIRELADLIEQGSKEPKDEFIPVDVSPLILGLQYYVRLNSILLREMQGIDAYPVFHWNFQSIENPQSRKCEVVQLLLNAVPVPNESTSWEHILEYRSDPNSQSRFLALRQWMSETARADLTPAEVEEKLEYLIDQYQQHMKFHRMKTNVGTLETIVTTSAEVLGDLVSFKWGKAAQALFSLKKRKVALLEGELTASGNEVAYIVKAKETFSS